MDLTELTREMHDFVRSMGWYEANSQRPQTLRPLRCWNTFSGRIPL
jgi:hypothetical protein